MRRVLERAPWGEIWRIALALAVGALFWVFTTVSMEANTQGGVTYSEAERAWTRFVDPAIGLAALALIPLRRRWRVAVPVLALTLGAVAPSVLGTALLALASLSTTRRWRAIIAVSGYSLLVTWIGQQILIRAGSGAAIGTTEIITTLVFTALMLATVVGFGAAIGARRDVVASLRAQVASAEREASRRLQQARATERARIAREMHDVLAHRISLIAMHAGVLSYRDDLPREQVRETASLLRDNADLAITELRAVLGVLRGTDEPEQARTPQPDLRLLPDLAAEMRSGGSAVELQISERAGRGPALDLTTVPSAVSRAAYRIVQEGLTNARKHAPGMPVRVQIRGNPEVGLDIEITNPAAPYRPGAEAPPGSGLGLMGLAERAQLSGGRLSHGVDRAGQFRIRAWLPWSAEPVTPARTDPATDPGADPPGEHQDSTHDPDHAGRDNQMGRP